MSDLDAGQVENLKPVIYYTPSK